MIAEDTAPAPRALTRPPRLGFAGVGWIGRHRMQAMLETGLVEAAAVLDPSPDMAAEALKLAPGAARADDFEGLLAMDLDGVVIATPSALHADQAIQALRRGAAVFCQKPLGRDAAEAGAAVAAARTTDRLLCVDFSYRFTEAMRAVRGRIGDGELGRVHAVDLVFHNAYGPDKPWFYDPGLSGGGCLMDLGVHLVDLALWTLGFPEVERIDADLFAGGRPLTAGAVEDYAAATLRLSSGAVVRIACSWRLPAGCEAVISAAFYGERGGAAMRNVGGSFYDFTAELYRGCETQVLTSPPDAWGGRAAADWAQRLARGARFDPEAERFVAVSQVLDRIYATAGRA
ncbi:MAG: Gfo/Idh/MocA family protein [Phenylobacterium sp.]|uniref:Gfo/Idh/MocA family protein n=1 Tax=Phenylobacterium sp. TaxID=1871053 RepID=UPI0039198A83